MSLLRRTSAILWKDLQLEWRRREIVASMLFFAALLLTVFNFALGPGREHLERAAPGLVWLAILFAAILGLGRSFSQEQEEDALEGLLLTPGSPAAIFLGKVLGNFLFMAVTVAVILLLVGFLYNLEIWGAALSVFGVGLLGILGLAALGTLFSAMVANARAREVMLPLLLLPLAVPLLLAGVETSKALLLGEGLGRIAGWLKLLVGFDVIFLTAGLLTFEYVVEP